MFVEYKFIIKYCVDALVLNIPISTLRQKSDKFQKLIFAKLLQKNDETIQIFSFNKNKASYVYETEEREFISFYLI